MGTHTVKFYNRFSFLYPVMNLFFVQPKGRLIAEVNTLPLGKLLEIGVGQGDHLRRYIRHDITGIDISAGMLEYAQKHKPENARLLQMDGEKLEFPDKSFDYVVISHVIAVVDHPERILDEAHRVLREGGKLLILNHFTPNNWLGWIDKAFSAVGDLLHFTSEFYVDRLKDVQNFELLEEVEFGRLSYFKLLIFAKA